MWKRILANVNNKIKNIIRINIEQKKIVHESTGHENTVTGIVVSHKNLETYTVSADKNIKIWK